MNRDVIYMRLIRFSSLILWVLIVVIPLLILLTSALRYTPNADNNVRIYSSLLKSFVLSAIIASIAVILGWFPGRILGTSNKHKDLLLFMLLMPLVMPRYVLYYAWSLISSPTTRLGSFLSSNTELARLVGTFSSSAVLVMWYWSLAALLIAQGWRKIDHQIWDSAALDVNGFNLFRNITLPLLIRPILLAFGVCFALSLSEFATFNLAGIRTVGTELAVLYELTGSEASLARAAYPMVIIAVIMAIILGRSAASWNFPEVGVGSVEIKSPKWQWFILFLLIGVSIIIPSLILIGNISDFQAFRQFFMLHMDELMWSLIIAFAAALMAYLIAYGAFSLVRNESSNNTLFNRSLFLIKASTLFLMMFIPASLVGVALIKMLASFDAPISIRQSWFIVSAGQACRFSGVTMILFLLAKHTQRKSLAEMASLDGTNGIQRLLYIYLPNTWPLLVGSFILVIIFGITEISATMILLPAGLPNFAQRLLNQMHYSRDQDVIASCLILVCLFFILIAFVVILFRLVRLRSVITIVFLFVFLFNLAGCNDESEYEHQPKVLYQFGNTGRGECQFIYPRAIDITNDELLFVIDKTGRIQKFDLEGGFIDLINMPEIETGKPTGLTVGPDGNLYVADTHYHRVLVFSPEGEIIKKWGQFGEENGEFIYPTDVTFSGDGRIYVSEYGGNDRISVFNEQGIFLYTFGSPGIEEGQLSRPSAVCVDKSLSRLYVADACNHRIAVYDFDGQLLRYIGNPGLAAGELRYPYDLAISPDGTLIVCEYGNNRLQLFSPEGESLNTFGRAGRLSGELAYPWGVAIDSKKRAFIVDAGNNRIQVWQL